MTVTAYLREFETLSTLISGFTPNNLLNYFLSGLREDIQRELYVLKLLDLLEATGMAKLIEDKCNSTRICTWPPPAFRSPLLQET